MRTSVFFSVAPVMLCMLLSCTRDKPLDREAAAETVRAPEERVTFTVAGSGSNIPLTTKLLDAYAETSGISVTIPPSIGTSGAVKALQAGKLDIGLISRPLSESELSSGLIQRKYAKIGIVFAVNPGVPDGDLGQEDLIGIYDGTKTKWSNGRTIIVLAREAGDSSNRVLEREIPGFKAVLEEALARKRWEIYYTDKEENDAIMTTPNSFGLTDTAALVDLRDGVKPLSYGGTEPTPENVRTGAYPLHKDLYFAWKEPLTEKARAFVEYVFSDGGRTVVSSNGGIPVDGE